MKSVTTTTGHNRHQKLAFTLVEMLIVIVIIGLLMVLSLPSLFQTLKANRLTTAGETLINQLALAQQIASSGNHPVEVRFYQYNSVESTETPRIQAFQLLRLFDQAQEDPTSLQGELITEKPLGIPIQFGNGVVVSESPALTPLIPESMPNDKKKYYKAADASFFAIRFNPDGSTTLKKDVTASHLTLVNDSDLDLDSPANFFTIQVDPYNGKLRSYRPY